MSSWVTVRHSLGPISWPSSACIPSTPCTSTVAIGAKSTKPGSVGPPAWKDLPVAIVVGANRKHFEPVRARLESTRHLGRDADGVEPLDLDDLVVPLHTPRAADHDVDLLGLLVLVAKGGTLIGLEVLMDKHCLFHI